MTPQLGHVNPKGTCNLMLALLFPFLCRECRLLGSCGIIVFYFILSFHAILINLEKLVWCLCFLIFYTKKDNLIIAGRFFQPLFWFSQSISNHKNWQF